MFGNYIKKPIRRKIDSIANTNVNLIEIFKTYFCGKIRRNMEK